MADQPIITEVSATDGDVAAVRQDMTAAAGVGGVPIDRIPYNDQLVRLEQSGVYSRRIANTDRCIRLITVPQKGGAAAQYHCSRPCVSVGDQRLCPDHDKSSFQPNQTPHGSKPRTYNSASIPLTKSEMEVRNDKGEVVGMLAEGRSIVPQGAHRADKAVEPAPGAIQISFSLEELADGHVLAAFVQRATEALDALPCNSVRQMKQIVTIQEKIAKLAKRGKNEHSTSAL